MPFSCRNTGFALGLVALLLVHPLPARAEDADTIRAQMTELRAMLTSLGSRLESMEARMGSLGDKVASNQSRLDVLASNHKLSPNAVGAHPAQGSGTDPVASLSSNDPEAGFVTDASVQDYRKASILLQAHKYPEAVLAFSSFVEKYPDHALAGSAQFGIGRAYLRQREYKLAAREYERVLTSYDRSPHISDTLRDLADTEDALKMPQQAAKHRQLLSSLFPQSPAASAPSEAPAAAADPAAQSAPGKADTPPAASEGHGSHDEHEASPSRTVSSNSYVDAPPTAPLAAPTQGAPSGH